MWECLWNKMWNQNKENFKLKEHTDTSWNSSKSALVRNMQVTQERFKEKKKVVILMIQPFIWRSKSPSVHCLAPAPCTSSPSKHEGQRALSSTTAKGLAYQGRAGGFLCVSVQRITDLGKVPWLGRCYIIKINSEWKHTTNKEGIKALAFSLTWTHAHLYKQTHSLV